MILQVYVDEQTFPIEVPDFVLREATEMFDRMDRDMDRGWQMSRTWVEKPDTVQRCQIAADRLLTALHQENEAVTAMMAGYILSRLPGVVGVRVDTTGDITQTEFMTGPQSVSP